mmetsp:Transcript_8931/g.24151  ORF Transcript_8931/g.24151 Transcript_8931/m.24151 type:complete len:272 (+) Transcript_8931:2134-2949(+)
MFVNCVSNTLQVPVASSVCLCNSSLAAVNSWTMPSWVPVNAALFSTKPDRFAISSLREVIVSLAEVSLDWAVSTIFQAFSTSLRRVVMVCWSSCDSFKAVWTFEALFTISPFRSLTFFINLRSWSWLLTRALWTFSYSARNSSNDSSPASVARTSWNSFSKVSKADNDRAWSSSSSNPLRPALAPSPSTSTSIVYWGPRGVRSSSAVGRGPSRVRGGAAAARGGAARWLWRGGGARRAARCACICIDDLAGHWPSAASEGAGVLAARSAAG